LNKPFIFDFNQIILPHLFSFKIPSFNLKIKATNTAVSVAYSLSVLSCSIGFG